MLPKSFTFRNLDNLLNCGCWGDPHCHTFDNAKFDFMGACKYDLVSTNCYGKNLPKGLVPFSVKHKQEMRSGRKGVSFFQYIDVEVYGDVYRLSQFTNSSTNFELNGLLRPVPFNDKENAIDVFQSGKNLLFSTGFGLTIVWNGNHLAEVRLCDAYANSVCGLCGNADGNSTLANEFVDRSGKAVPIEGSQNTKFFRWGSHWKTFLDDGSTDQDGSQ